MAQFETQDELQELRELVELTLDRCNPTDLPHLCAMNATEAGREVVREAVTRNCIQRGMSPSAAMVALEQEYDFTTLD